MFLFTIGRDLWKSLGGVDRCYWVGILVCELSSCIRAGCESLVVRCLGVGRSGRVGFIIDFRWSSRDGGCISL
jgi:hypothetical protein